MISFCSRWTACSIGVLQAVTVDLQLLQLLCVYTDPRVAITS